MNGGVSVDKEEPPDLEQFRNQEDKLSADDHAPALDIGYPVAKQETADPDNESDNRKLPQVHERYRNKLQGAYQLQKETLRSVQQKF